MDDTASIIAPETVLNAPSAVVVFGRDEGGKAHASRFEPADAALAERAAGLMGMRALRLTTVEQQELAAELPEGRVFATGRAFVPFVKAAVFEQLEADPDSFTPERPPEADMPPSAPPRPKGRRSASPATDGTYGGQDALSEPAEPPADRAAITLGHRVLAAELYDPEIWYVAQVTALREPDLLQLRWVSAQWINEPPFVRHREHLALLPAALGADAD
ncbi:hypothetical protein [Lichenibacterium ramalinae]|uniref:Uncharacterized protein n=1 Tax=Lichenibacterium ramalinae TaxID=2316527 RepID=A0A4Q2RA91_9HYPH|nr:hypothetical protein [Lichenibacterium ramalinae]RYB02470.1 hypothetical protein D3272_21360 [Lichenibacterium ramalinae]